MSDYTRIVGTDPDWSEFNQRFDLVHSPLYGSAGFTAGALELSDDEWAAISVAARFYTFTAGMDEVTGLEHKRVRPLLLGILARKP